MSGNRIVRTKTIDGVVTPAFIHNGPSYFFVNLPVYADGLVNCWELVDLPLFKKKLRQGWVTTAVPDGQEIHVHGLGSWTVVDGDWPCSATKFFNRVTELYPSDEGREVRGPSALTREAGSARSVRDGPKF